MAAIDFPSGARLLRMTLLATLGLMAIFIEAAPLGVAPQSMPSPDLLFCVVAAIAVRRPRSAPMLLIFLLGLARDLLTDLPVGLGALTLVLGTEFLKSRSASFARRTLAVEWVSFMAVVLAMLAMQWALVFVTFVQPPYLFDLLRQWILTAVAYPPMVLTIRWVFGIGWGPLEKRREE